MNKSQFIGFLWKYNGWK